MIDSSSRTFVSSAAATTLLPLQLSDDAVLQSGSFRGLNRNNEENALACVHSWVQGLSCLDPSPHHHNWLTVKQGGDDTFSKFPDQLTALVRHALPSIGVQAVAYPKFDTRGDLKECVARFRDWYDAMRYSY